jgi:hypothetical protein
MSRELDLRIRKEILHNLVDMASRYYTNGTQLFQAGFTSFQPVLDADFASCSEDEKQFHRSYMIECAKEWIGTDASAGVVLFGNGDGYKSPLLEGLRRTRDLAGYGKEFYQSNPSESWRCWLSPCHIADRKRFLEDTEGYGRAVTTVQQKVKAEESNEVRLHSSWNLSALRNSPKNIMVECKKLLQSVLQTYGFNLSQEVRSSWLVFSKPISGDFALLFVFRVEFGPASQQGSFLANLLLCRSRFVDWQPQNSTEYSAERFVDIRLWEAAPFFWQSYRSFGDLGKLEVNVRAALELFAVEKEFVLRTLEETLDRIGP